MPLRGRPGTAASAVGGRGVIIATAGHVDHGKTSLIKALTGVDTDRLAEEKRRGLSIELGFAWLAVEGGPPLGFVDVPGHERFISTMLAGVAAVDLALLVVAADDGPMPQTLEHLAILRLLGVEQLVLVISRCDLVENERQQALSVELAELLSEQGWPDAPQFAVSSLTGQGLDVLREHLLNGAREHQRRVVAGHARLMVDRRFSIDGAGCVVTGTLISGRIESGQSLFGNGHSLRVRGLQMAGNNATQIEAGQRCALNLAGDIDAAQPQRGDWLTEVAVAGSSRLDVALTQLPDSHWHRGVLQLHLGTGVHPLRAVILQEGQPALAQLLLEQPVQALWGDRFIIRDPAANQTLGGGRVLDPQGLQRGRSKPERLALLRHWQKADGPRAALLAALQQAPVALDGFAVRFNLTQGEQRQLLDELRHSAASIELLDAARQHWLMLAGQIDSAWARLHQRLQDWHAAHPERLGPGEGELALASTLQLPLVLGRALLQRWHGEGRLRRQAWAWHLPEHQPQLLAEDRALLERVSAQLLPSGLRPPIVGELSQALGIELETLKAFLRRMQRAGELIAVAPNRYYLPEQVDGLVAVARQLVADSPSGSFNAAEYRDASGIGRNLTIQVLEYLDRAGVTRFAREQRFLVAG
ncbi:selenocysteine-specific translation elongation factor [Pseudomonas sp. WN033]|nr:selenocysteine-specific translation elongation factor [Pseudomonas sp. WN033]